MSVNSIYHYYNKTFLSNNKLMAYIYTDYLKWPRPSKKVTFVDNVDAQPATDDPIHLSNIIVDLKNEPRPRL
ncbi:13587cef-5a49-401c-8dc0-968b7b7aa55e [Thermothielavioides terrestris]|uniref:13587cef-5a49-401c-8dc0-968b7b7aa55e n=1 Tax=Thermothielavioides terrestris TaxID=2587410 RepID=A0A446BSF8_9PEZI|nr:13587cef-5a49-401c-8dc0-968b7b7aa55e [Thermothielavioides terrestris]